MPLSYFKSYYNIFSRDAEQALRTANTIWPTYMSEYTERRNYMNRAMAACNVLLKLKLCRIMSIFLSMLILNLAFIDLLKILRVEVPEFCVKNLNF